MFILCSVFGSCLDGDTDKVAGISEILSFEFTVKMSEFLWQVTLEIKMLAINALLEGQIFDNNQMQNGLIHYIGGIFQPKLDILFGDRLSGSVCYCGYHTQNMTLCLSLVFQIVADVDDMQIFLLSMNYVIVMMIGHVRQPSNDILQCFGMVGLGKDISLE